MTCVSCVVFIECMESKEANAPPPETVSVAEFQEVQAPLYGEIRLTEREQFPLDLVERLVDAPSWSRADADFVLLDLPIDEDLQRYLHSLAHAFSIDYALLLAVIETESSFTPDIVSGNCYGLMQIHTINHEWLSNHLGISDFLDPYENTLAGVTVLRGLFDSYDTTEQVLMAYNCGESGAKNLWQQNIFTTSYTKKVVEKSLKYQELLGE
ncbi:MAG: transglycosylase SLT domain-containing protein [Bacillota bacterium]